MYINESIQISCSIETFTIDISNHILQFSQVCTHDKNNICQICVMLNTFQKANCKIRTTAVKFIDEYDNLLLVQFLFCLSKTVTFTYINKEFFDSRTKTFIRFLLLLVSIEHLWSCPRTRKTLYAFQYFRRQWIDAYIYR